MTGSLDQVWPATPPDHNDCARFLVDSMAKLGCEIAVSTHPPLVATPYRQPPARCPHGVLFWFEPTTDQIAVWVRDGVE